MVRLLLSRGADVKAVDSDQRTALLLASWNRLHGPAIIPLLAEAGVDLDAVDADGNTALHHGLCGNGLIMRTLAPLYPPGQQCARFFPSADCPDPIGCMREGALFGCTVYEDVFWGNGFFFCEV